MSARMNPATDAVQRAQAAYPKTLKSVVNYFGPVPYGTEKVDTRTADKRLAQMPPEQMAQMAMQDPMKAAAVAQRLNTLKQRASGEMPLPAQDVYEGGDK